VRFAVQDISPPSTLYIARNDSLIVDWWDRQGLGAELNGRILRPDGEVTPFSQQLVTTGTAGDRNRVRIELTEGFLLSVCAAPLTPIEPARGQLFIRAVLWRGTTASGAPVATVMSDYVTADYYPSWPHSALRNSLDGRGRVGGVAVADPAAGSDWSYTLAAGQYWRLEGLRARLVTDATVATRLPQLEILPGGFLCILTRGTNAHTASLTVDYTAGDWGIRSAATEALQYWPVPSDIRLREGNVIRVVTANLQAGDQWSLIAIGAEEWIADY
jgi:hypothetical protein